MRQKGTSVPNYRTVFSALPTGVKQPNATAVATIIDPVDGGRRKSSSSYMFCCEALLSAICTDLLAFCEGVNVFGGSCRDEADEQYCSSTVALEEFLCALEPAGGHQCVAGPHRSTNGHPTSWLTQYPIGPPSNVPRMPDTMICQSFICPC